MPPNEAALIQVFLHLPEQAKRASFLAGSMDSSATLKGTRSLEIEIKRGARVEVSLAVNGLLIDEPVQSVVWRGQPVFCQFLITDPGRDERPQLFSGGARKHRRKFGWMYQIPYFIRFFCSKLRNRGLWVTTPTDMETRSCPMPRRTARRS